MAVKIATENGLVTLRVRVQPRARGISAVLQLVSYVEGTARELSSWWLDSTMLGLPARLSSQWLPTRKLPLAVTDGLRAGLEALGLAPGLPLWLHLVKPYGFLGALDWETALVPELGRPLLRLPDFLERPRENRAVLDVAVVCSEPVSEPRLNPPQVLQDVVDAVLTGSRRSRTRIHIFPDEVYYDSLRIGFAGEPRVAVHDPQGAQVHGVLPRGNGAGVNAPGDKSSELQSPWLKWMRDSMKGRSLDAVHFVAHGFVADQRPALALAESPLANRDRRDARYVGVGEVAAFLTQVGAWSAVFSSPPANYSEAGLRLLADTLAQTRPGPVLYHTLGAPGPDPALKAMYGFLYAPAPSPVPWQERWFAYCQPALIDMLATVPPTMATPASVALDANSRLFDSLTVPPPAVVAGRRQSRGRGDVAAAVPPPAPGEAPSWVSAAQRYVEQQSMQLQRDGRDDDATSRVSDEVERTLAKLQSIVGGVASGDLK
ncbi:MAG: hypothetical protein ABI633_14005 [Burkholderiales bacterium]